ncbi:hypothetical protein IFM89_001978 [Coptis chinensis]|uniref:Uncharacterized protein n=1 Tax=Coptis chinensis TaxID=261450 RepID=A0A835HKX6_9MAGN|nr:hypothetical protein IFM89_001978 [Coptis chinensis]
MDFLQQKHDLFNRQEEEVKNSQQFGSVDVHPELSLGPSRHGLLLAETTNSSSSDSYTKASRKRKCC